MAAKKKAKKVRPRRKYRRFRRFHTPGEHRWRLWTHDLDTLLHELVKNPRLHNADPGKLVARAAAFADALRAMQDTRRPKNLSADYD